MRQLLFDQLDFEPARVYWNKLNVDPDSSPYQELDHDDCDYESVLFMRFPNGIALDVMWHPEVKPGGEFVVELVQDSEEWNPYAEIRCKTFRELMTVVRDAAKAVRDRPSVPKLGDSEK